MEDEEGWGGIAEGTLAIHWFAWYFHQPCCGSSASWHALGGWVGGFWGWARGQVGRWAGETSVGGLVRQNVSESDTQRGG